MSIEEIGCCGAYCKTCKAYAEKTCLGCKLGYNSGERNLSKAKCKMKVCCINKEHYTCADCNEYKSCLLLNEFYGKNGYKYLKYAQATEYIRQNGYDSFIEIADNWKNAYGKY